MNTWKEKGKKADRGAEDLKRILRKKLVKRKNENECSNSVGHNGDLNKRDYGCREP